MSAKLTLEAKLLFIFNQFSFIMYSSKNTQFEILAAVLHSGKSRLTVLDYDIETNSMLHRSLWWALLPVTFCLQYS